MGILQVFDFIMDGLDKYRALYRKMAQLARDGVISALPHGGHSHYSRQVRVRAQKLTCTKLSKKRWL